MLTRKTGVVVVAKGGGSEERAAVAIMHVDT